MIVVQHKIYTALSILFTMLIVLGNIVCQKFVYLSILSLHTFELSAGCILYPVTYMLSDLIAEFYGKESARYCIRVAMAMNIIMALLLAFIDQLTATQWSKVDNLTFHNVFGLYSVFLMGSLLACYISQYIDITIYLLLRGITRGKIIWLRTLVSTSLSLFIDTCVVVCFTALFGALPFEQVSSLIFNSYLYKLCASVCCVPLLYAGILFINRITSGRFAISVSKSYVEMT